jgi:histone H3/H4
MEATPPANGRRPSTGVARTPSRTPARRAISVEPPSSRRSVHTPLDHTATREFANSIRRGIAASGGRRSNAPTPHARAARRALDQRRTALFTPGKNRRRSQVAKRESPRDLLRVLGRTLAPKSQRIVSSSSPPDAPSSTSQPTHRLDVDDDDDELPIDRPRLSLPLDEEDDDDDDDLLPPRSSILEDPDNYTIELDRRATSEQPPRLSRTSFGSLPMSEIFENDLGDIGEDSDFFSGLLEDLQARAAANDVSYERFDADQTRRTTLGRESDSGFQVPVGLDEQSTFMMPEPLADLPQRSSSPIDQGPADYMFDDQPVMDDGVPDVGMPDDDETEDEVEPDMGLAMDQDMDQDTDQDVGQDVDDEQELEQDSRLFATTPRRLPRQAKGKAPAKRKRISRHGIEYPALPSAFIKGVAQKALQSSGLSNRRISPETLTALTQASEWFFEQLGDDLGAYASHAKRKTIEESDMVTLMRRYVVESLGILFGPFSLANIVQTTTNRIHYNRLLARAKASAQRTPARAENATTTTSESAPFQKGASQ